MCSTRSPCALCQRISAESSACLASLTVRQRRRQRHFAWQDIATRAAERSLRWMAHSNRAKTTYRISSMVEHDLGVKWWANTLNCSINLNISYTILLFYMYRIRFCMNFLCLLWLSDAGCARSTETKWNHPSLEWVYVWCSLADGIVSNHLRKRTPSSLRPHCALEYSRM